MFSFQTRVTLATFGVAALAIAGLTLGALILGAELHERHQLETDEAAFALLAELARAELPSHRLQVLTQATTRLAGSPSVEQALVTDESKRILATSDPALLGTLLEDSPGWQLTVVYSPSGRAATVGMLRSTGGWRDHMSAKLGSLALLCLMASALIAMPLAHGLTRRLGELRSAAQRVLDEVPSENDEVTTISTALEKLHQTETPDRSRLDRRDRQLQRLADELPVAVSYTSSDLRVLFANHLVSVWLGWEREALVGRPLSDLLPTDFYEESLRGLAPALRGERVHRERQVTLDGRPAVLSVINVPDRDASGTVRGVFSIMRNITDQRAERIEQQRLVQELTAKNGELESVSYTVSHDLKGPLATILGSADLIELGLGDAGIDLSSAAGERMAQDLDQIRHASSTMRKMLDEVLELARVGLVANRESRVDLRQLAEDVVQLLAGRIGSCGTAVRIDPALPTVIGDRQRLQRVLLNLVDNAVKFSAGSAEPRVEVGQRTIGDEVTFFVRDNGSGIPLEQQAQVFDLFRKLDPESDGTGVGLAIVQRIVHAHGGRIWVESAGVNQGTSFYFQLKAEPEAPPRPALGAGAASGGFPSLEGGEVSSPVAPALSVPKTASSSSS